VVVDKDADNDFSACGLLRLLSAIDTADGNVVIDD
jgi:hypothetical protein